MAGRLEFRGVEILVRSNKEIHDDFFRKAAIVMRRFQNNEIGYTEAVDLLGRDSNMDKDIVEFVCDVMSEIDGFPKYFSGLLDVFERGATIDDVRRFMRD